MSTSVFRDGDITPVPPLLARDAADGEYEVVDQNGLVVARGLVGWNSSVAIARLLEQGVRGDGLCLDHLNELAGGRCLSCVLGVRRNPYSAVQR